MPTFKVLLGAQKQDKTFPVMIQLYHNKQKKYLPTSYFVEKKQVSIKKKEGDKTEARLKDEFVIATLNGTIVKYREKLLKLPDINNRSVDFIKEYLSAPETPNEIDFIAFGRTFIKTQALSTGKNTETVLNALVDFLGVESISVQKINLKLLQAFAAYLQSERKVKRNDGNGGEREFVLKPVSATAIKDYIGKLRQIFIAARDEYNDEEGGQITIAHYPFRKFKMPKASRPQKRNVKGEVIRMISQVPNSNRRSDLARDVFLLSFYLVGMNTVDLYNVKEFKNGRLNYNRTKTESRKHDASFISVKVEPEALEIMEKYRDFTGKRIFNFYHLYASPDYFSKAVNTGLVSVAEDVNKEAVKKHGGAAIDKKITSYYARGAWSTIARNECGISKEDIHFALNHADPAMKITDLYIEEDRAIIDRANRKVLDFIFGHDVEKVTT